MGSIPRYYSVAEPGKVPGSPPPLIFRPNWGPEGPKKSFWRSPPFISGFGWLPPPPPVVPPSPLSEGLDPPPLLTYSFPPRSKCLFKLLQSVAQNLSGMWRSTFEIGTSQPRSVTKFALKSPSLWVNKRAFWYGFCAGARANRLSVIEALNRPCHGFRRHLDK